MSRYISDSSGHPDVPNRITTLCGSIAEFDESSGISYRCTECMAVIGSVGMPRECKEIYEMQEVIDKLKGPQNGRNGIR